MTKTIAIFGLALALALSGCAFPSFGKPAADASPASCGSLTLNISALGSSSGRTIVPASSDLPAIASYVITLTRTGSTTVTTTVTSSPCTIDTLDAGDWTIQVDGKTAAPATVASGTGSVTIVASTPATATVSLSYVEAATGSSGSASVTLLFPSTLGIDSVSGSLDGVGIDSSLALDLVNSKVVFSSTSIESASPLLSMTLKKGAVKLLVWTEGVWVYKGITTTASVTLDSALFGSAPAAPGSLTAALQTDNRSVLLTWPNVNIATTYQVERSINAGVDYTILSAAIAAGSISYTDSTSSAGTTCSYRISATNYFGTSGYTATTGSTVIPTGVISIAALAGATAPVVAATPVTAITATDQYSGTVTWSGTPSTFAASTVYTATITLTAKTGYTLTGVAANFFTVAGATSATNPANSGVVTAVFPAAARVITSSFYLPKPITGNTPVTTVTTAQYTGTVTWSGSPATFVAGIDYTATITLTAKTGYTLTGVAANFFTLSGATSTNPANSGVVTVEFLKPVTVTAISGVTAPVGGATPVTAFTDTQYSGTVTWSGSPSIFASATEYTATITLTARTGYLLTDVTENFFTVAGAVKVTNSQRSGVVTAVFPGPAIVGVTAPVRNAMPVLFSTSSTWYGGSIAWSGSPTSFAGGTVYTATITLTALTWCTLSGVPANFFTVAGASSVTNPAGSGVVTAVFPATALATPDNNIINDVTKPQAGATPVTSLSATAYTGTVTWSGSPTTFAANTVYTATITLTAKTGYTFTGVPANYFRVDDSFAAVTHSANSGVVTAVFPATGPMPVVFSGLQAVGTTLTLTFSADPTTLVYNDIRVTGADTTGFLAGGGTTRSLEMTNPTAGTDAIWVDIVSQPTGYVIKTSFPNGGNWRKTTWSLAR
ncbi:MAG: hypothetical protein WCQ50_16935 [Spirochaetota bacterium]